MLANMRGTGPPVVEHDSPEGSDIGWKDLESPKGNGLDGVRGIYSVNNLDWFMVTNIYLLL